MDIEAFQKKHADKCYLEHDGFIYYRVTRLDGQSATLSEKEIDRAIAYAESQRPKIVMDSSKQQLEQYNVWTNVKEYLLFRKHKTEINR